MNWFTREFVSNKSIEDKAKLVLRLDNECEHVEEDNGVIYVVSYECDSFGRESTGLCNECWDKATKEDDEEEVTCNDCNGVFPKSSTTQWKWYDFYAPQGDEPIVVCDLCRGKEKHIIRCDKDHADYCAEMNYQQELEDRDEDDFY